MDGEKDRYRYSGCIEALIFLQGTIQPNPCKFHSPHGVEYKYLSVKTQNSISIRFRAKNRGPEEDVL
jgi:hypothetical protein